MTPIVPVFFVRIFRWKHLALTNKIAALDDCCKATRFETIWFENSKTLLYIIEALSVLPLPRIDAGDQ